MRSSAFANIETKERKEGRKGGRRCDGEAKLGLEIKSNQINPKNQSGNQKMCVGQANSSGGRKKGRKERVWSYERMQLKKRGLSPHNRK